MAARFVNCPAIVRLRFRFGARLRVSAYACMRMHSLVLVLVRMQGYAFAAYPGSVPSRTIGSQALASSPDSRWENARSRRNRFTYVSYLED